MKNVKLTASPVHSAVKQGTTEDVLVALARSHARVQAAGVADLTNSSGGSGTAVNLVETAFANEAASGSSLAGEATVEAANAKLANAVATLAAKANAAAAAIGVSALTDNSGGTSGGDTLAAVDQSVTGAATGAQATQANVTRLAVNNALYEVAVKVNELAVATGHDVLVVDNSDGYAADGTIAVIATDAGTVADPGVGKAEFDAALVIWANTIDAIADKLATIVSTSAPLVVVE
jgi:hypothetical protein